MTTITDETGLIAYCGLYCGTCGMFRQGLCPACKKNARADWCPVRACCREHGYASCADCRLVADVSKCRDYNSTGTRLMGRLLQADRREGIACLCREGYAAYARRMRGNDEHDDS